MAFVPLANALTLLQLSLLLFCNPITVYGVSTPPPPAQSPHPAAPPPPHHHHHHHHHQPTASPTPPPTQSPPVTPPPKVAPTPPPKVAPVAPSPPPKVAPTPSPKLPSPPPKLPSPPPKVAPTTPPKRPPFPPPKVPAPPPKVAPTPRKMVAVQGVVFCKSCKFTGVDTLMGAVPLAGAVVKLRCNNTKYGLVEQTRTDKNGYFFFMPQKLTTTAFHKCKVFLVSSPLATCSSPTNLHGGVAGAMLIPSIKEPVKKMPFQLFSVGPFAFEPHKKLPCSHKK